MLVKVYIGKKQNVFMAGTKKKTSVNIDEKLWKEFKKAAIDMNKDVSGLLEEAIVETLKKRKRG